MEIIGDSSQREKMEFLLSDEDRFINAMWNPVVKHTKDVKEGDIEFIIRKDGEPVKEIFFNGKWWRKEYVPSRSIIKEHETEETLSIYIDGEWVILCEDLKVKNPEQEKKYSRLVFVEAL